MVKLEKYFKIFFKLSYVFIFGSKKKKQFIILVFIIQTTLEDKKICSGVFLDLKQQYGTSDKIKKKIPDQYYWILKLYLEDRWFNVKIENDFLRLHPIPSGGSPRKHSRTPLYIIYSGYLYIRGYFYRYLRG